MVDLIHRFEQIKKKPISPYMSGHVINVFLYNDKCSKNEDGSIPVIIRPDPVESKKKKSIN
tara:strand:+ start:562 stop:744 length:183 start_codon:yes stop_codon:yes gene_type:complete